ncbi:MAG: glycerol-3-phosphate dehydrogenase/oxidase [Leptospiraceae bacterium]|nr:glycerol-3-phosphate dehydrogenase/oxidase [Leptospiraceae bacterium]MDW8307240.1 glycerol-3-phosphate dehydrogenase/oxidase [Leptospiraceae bacterium]
MHRDLRLLEKEVFDILIIGGGISGACIAHEAALRGLKVALIEKEDFGHATSAATSKLIHGGLRYLARLDFSVVRESLRERRYLEQILPHQAFPLPFLLPVYDYFNTPRFLLSLGLTLYDLLSFDKNRLVDPSKHLPNKRWLSKHDALKLEPKLDPTGLQGAFLYYDVLNRHPERSNLDFVLTAAENGAVVANYVAFEDFITEEYHAKKRVRGVVARDVFENKLFPIEAKVTVNAAGPWGDIVLSKLHKNPVRQLIRSKGIHLLFPRVHGDYAITFETRDRRHFFVIPWLNFTLLGTTDTPYRGDPDNVRVSEKDIAEFMDVVNAHIPLNLKRKDLLYAYVGLRPLLFEGTSDTYKASRKHEIVDHEKVEGVGGLFSVFGGKWTTSRALAEETVNKIVARQKWAVKKSASHKIPVSAGRIGPYYSEFVQKMHLKYDRAYGEKTVARMVEIYGAHGEKVLQLAEEQKNLSEIIDPESGLIRAEIHHAVKHELAQTLNDFLFRRSGIANMGPVPRKTVEFVAAEMAKLLHWKSSRKKEEIARYEKTLYFPKSD